MAGKKGGGYLSIVSRGSGGWKGSGQLNIEGGKEGGGCLFGRKE